jgi:tetratricopeptide (TPR) repeat protein
MADRFIAETKMADDAHIQMLRGNALYRLDRFAEAIDALKVAAAAPDAPKGAAEMLMDSYVQADRLPEAVAMAEANAAKNPQDKRIQLNLANVYAMADQPDKAAAVFERLRASGMLTDAKDYELAYKLLANLEGRERDTIAFINAGLEKGILKPSAQLYAVLGQSYYFSEQIPQAIDAWGKGAPMAPDGEMFLNLGKVNSQEEHWAEAKAAAQQALAKGVKKPGEAWIVIAGADLSMGNKAGAIAGYREAAKHAGSRDEANRMLRSLGQ